MNYLGKLPPQDNKTEQKVLGSLLLEKDAIINVADLLKPEMFYKDEYKIIYRCISDMFNNSKQIDLLTVSNYLEKSNELEKIGGIFGLSELTNNVGSSENIESHARIIVEKYMLREIISLSAQLSTKAYENSDPFDLLAESEKLLENINNSVGSEDLTDSVDVLNDAISELERITLIAENDGLRGVPS